MKTGQVLKRDGASCRQVEKPWGCELIWAETERYVGKILHIDCGESLSLQYHELKDETIMVLRGRIGLVYFAHGEPEQRLNLSQGQAFRIRPGLRHRMIALEESDVIEVSTPEIDDVVRLADRYGRVPGSRKLVPVAARNPEK
jgi:mannose-6-phosphate isomerase-like protein (cupin superfamily)